MSGEDTHKASPHGTGANSSSSTVGGGGGSVAVVSGRSSALPAAPPGFRPLRRSMTVAPDMTAAARRRSSSRPLSPLGSFEPPKRRYSALSEEIFNPSGTSLERHETSSWASVPLIFALLPAFGGLFFKNGSSIATDLILLGLSAVFLRWAVTQPWIWYYSAQQIRVGEEALAEREMDMEDEDDEIQPSREPTGTSTEGTNGHPPEIAPTPRRQNTRRQALGKLYLHEVSALASCFTFPLLAAALLHTIRGQLTRPSEGLVSNYNLTIFLLAAEIRPLGQLMKLFQARTLHLQRVVDTHPYRVTAAAAPQPSGAPDDEEVIRRLDELEAHAVMGRAGVVQEVRKAMQPEMEAMKRAIRQYEKRMAMMAVQMDTRLGAIDTRLNDAVSLAAEAAKGGMARRSFLGWLTEMLVEAAMFPPNVMLSVMAFPIMVASKVLGRSNAVPQTQGLPKGGHHKQGVGARRPGKDRVSHS